MASNLQPGVTDSHPHFFPPDPPGCKECGAELEDAGAGDLECPNEECPEHEMRIDPAEAYEPAEPDYDNMPGGADDDDRGRF